MNSKEIQSHTLREQMRDKRASLSPLQIEAFSKVITSKLTELQPLIDARSIMGFASIRNEVNLTSYLELQAGQGKKIFLPRAERDGRLAAVEFNDWQSARPGLYDIMEPTGTEADPSCIDAVIVPGLVFDARGYRLGYGKGYYDRFLPLLPKKTFICGVCYEFQVVDDISPHEADIPMHWIVTEKSELVIDWDFF